MITRSEKIKAGIFFVSGIVLFAAILLFLGYLETREEGQYYHSYFRDVANLNEGAPVKYNGVKVGKVKDISIPEPGKPHVRVDYLIEKPDLVTPNTHARLSYVTYLSGNQAISLTPRTEPPDAEMEDGQIPSKRAETTMAFESLVDGIEGLNELIKQNSENVTALIDNSREMWEDINTLISGDPPPDNVPEGSLLSVSHRLDDLLKELQTVTGKLDNTLDQTQVTLAEGENTLSQTRQLTADVQGTVGENRKDLRSSMRSLPGAINEVEQAATEIDELAISLQQSSRAMENILDDNSGALNATLRSIMRSTEDLQEFTRKLRSRPSLLLRSPAPEKREVE